MSKTLTDAGCRVLARLLDMASDEFANHGCNDFDLGHIVPLREERHAIVREFEQRNSGSADYDPEATYDNFNDWVLMAHFADKLGRP